MFRSGVGRWLRVAFADVVLAIKSVVRPWTDLRAVELTQIDVVRAVADQKSDLARAAASIDALTLELSRMNARIAEQDQKIRELEDAGARDDCGSARTPPPSVESPPAVENRGAMSRSEPD